MDASGAGAVVRSGSRSTSSKSASYPEHEPRRITKHVATGRGSRNVDGADERKPAVVREDLEPGTGVSKRPFVDPRERRDLDGRRRGDGEGAGLVVVLDREEVDPTDPEAAELGVDLDRGGARSQHGYLRPGECLRGVALPGQAGDRGGEGGRRGLARVALRAICAVDEETIRLE